MIKPFKFKPKQQERDRLGPGKVYGVIERLTLSAAHLLA